MILNVGRRVELVKAFKNAAIDLNINSDIIGTDISKLAPAIYFCDKYYKLPKISSSDYIEKIIELSIKENISLIIPTIDTDLTKLSKNRNKIFEKSKAKVMVSDLNVIKICRDKFKTQKYIESIGFKMPKLITDKEIMNGNYSFPLFIKPKSGSSSKNTYKIKNKYELDLYKNTIENPIIQDFIDGDEYSVDVFLDFDSKIISIVPRLRISTRSGEISKGLVIKDKKIIEYIMNLMNILKPVGQITVQLIKNENGIFIIEINPRFGGGSPMSIMAGANSCKNLFYILMKKSLQYSDDYENEIIFLRYDETMKLKKSKVYND